MVIYYLLTGCFFLYMYDSWLVYLSPLEKHGCIAFVSYRPSLLKRTAGMKVGILYRRKKVVGVLTGLQCMPEKVIRLIL